MLDLEGRRSLVPGRQEDQGLGLMHVLAGGAAETARRTHDDARRQPFVDQLHQPLFHDQSLIDRVVEASTLRAVDGDEETALVLGWRQLLGNGDVQGDTGSDSAQHQSAEQRRMRDRAFEHASVTAFDAFEQLVDGERQSGVAFTLDQQLAAHHRRQGQRDQCRYRHRGRQRDAELAEEYAEIALQEGDRQEHADQHGGGGDHRKRHLTGAALGGNQSRLAQIDPALAVLQHHDGIVDHQTDAQHQRQQGDQVDRKAEGIQANEGGDDAHRDGHRRNQRRAPAAQEEIDHRDHQQHGDAQREIHLVDGRIDVGGTVEGHVQGHAARQGLRDSRGLGLHGLGDADGVGGRLLDHAHADLQHGIAAQHVAAIGRPQLHLGHFAQAHHMAVAALDQRQCREFLG